MNSTKRSVGVHRNNQPPRWAKTLAVLAGITVATWTTWCSVVALIGGTMPLIDYHTERSVITFLLTLFVGEPILITIAYRAVILVLLSNPFRGR